MELFIQSGIYATRRPQVGDVIVCKAFARGWRYYRNGHDGKLGEPFGPVRVMDVFLRANACHEDCHDETRGEARFVVEESHSSDRRIEWSNNGRIYTNEPAYISETGWVIRARRLRDNGTYDPGGELVEFTTFMLREAQDIIRRTNAKALREGWTNPENVEFIVETPVRVVGRMTRTVHFE